MIRYKRSIKRDLAFLLVLIVFLTSGIIILTSYYYIKEKRLDSLNKEADELINQLSDSVAFYVWNYAENDISNTAASFLVIDEIVYIRIAYDNHEVIFNKQGNYEDNLINRSRSIRYAGDQDIGTAEISVSRYKIFRKNREYLYMAVMLTAIILIIIIFSIKVLLSVYMEKPLRNLQVAINEIASGNYEKRLKPVSQLEIKGIIADVNNMAQMISERESGLRQVQDYLKNIIEAMASIIITIDGEYIIRQVNSRAYQLIQFRRHDITGSVLFEETSFFDKYRDIIQKVNEELIIQEFRRENIVDSSQASRYYDIMFYPYSNIAKGGVVIRIDDVSRAVENEEKIKKIQKMEVLSSLTGGLAHDFNNILGGIIGAVSLLEWELANEKHIDQTALKENLEIIQSSANRAENIVTHLLTLAREHQFEFHAADLNEIVKQVHDICQNSLEKNIKVQATYADEKALVMADQNQIEQVLLNLSINSSHAMTIMRKEGEAQGGVLCFYIEKIHADRTFCDYHPEATGNDYWLVSVQDTGVGIEKKIIPKIFDPFFSTKKKIKGTGLGLSMVYNIITEHKGFIDVYSECGVGTTVNIYLPAVAQKEIVSTNNKEKDTLKLKGSVLLCDDEEAVRKIGSEMLKACGIDVITARDGFEAIELFKKHKAEIKAVIIDAIMPGITGDLVVRELMEIKRDIRIIASSGFRRDNHVENILAYDGVVFLSKPYTLDKMKEALLKIFRNDTGKGF